jgi:diaminopimelate decarboxylase
MEKWSGNLDFEELAGRFGTPLYVINPEQIKRNFKIFEDLTGGPERICYPVKANPSLSILREIARLGGGADCASAHEVNLAILSGIPANRIIYNSPVPDIALINELLASGASVVADSSEILTDMKNNIRKKDLNGSIYVRVNPEKPVEYLHKADWQEFTAHASCCSKFGIPSEELVGLLKKFTLPVTGIHMHVGTRMDNMASFINALTFLHDLVDEIEKKTDHRINTIDFGGGLGIDFLEDDNVPSLDEFAGELHKHLKESVRYMVEPGHSLVGNAIGLISRIREMKSIRGRRWAIMDVGTNQLIPVTLLSWRHRILDKNHKPLPASGSDAVGGPLCFAGDILMTETNLQGMKKNDVLFFQHMGAYCSAVGNRFNGLMSPAQITVTDEGYASIDVLKEDDFCDPVLLGFDWRNDEKQWGEAVMIDRDTVENLGSRYLHHELNEDTYEFLETSQSSDRTLDFKLKVSTSLGVISMPLAVRIASDATIISALYLIGKHRKDVSVWGTRLFMTGDQMIKTNRPVNCRISISHALKLSSDRHSQFVVYWDINNGKFRGIFRITL